MIATLPMYDLPAARAATDAWWAGIARWLRRAGLRGVPERLARGADETAAWTRHDLLLTQTCGYPLVGALASHLRPVATPVYRAPGCRGPRYRSLVVVRGDDPAADLRDLHRSICAVNRRDSHSGYNALRAAVAPLAGGAPFFARAVATGSHRRSLEAVRAGRARVCAVDCVTHALLARHDPAALRATRVLAETPSAPGLPYAVRAETSDADGRRIRDALHAAVVDPDLRAARDELLIEDMEALPGAAYARIARLERRAWRLGAGRLAVAEPWAAETAAETPAGNSRRRPGLE